MNLAHIHTIYFLGIGGIGMSALARYFHLEGYTVIGYDKTATPLTKSLENEGIQISYIDQGKEIQELLKSKQNTLIVYTPAIPKNHREFLYFQEEQYLLVKRAELLGVITKNHRCLAVAGTHGKTTTSSLLAHIFEYNKIPCTAFLGGISSNLQSNLLLHKNPEWIIVEADEFDRSFLHLAPYASIITSTDADHLDIYENASSLLDSFQAYAKQVDENGLLILESSLALASSTTTWRYSGKNEEPGDYKITNFSYENEQFAFDIISPTKNWENVKLGIPGIHNAENALATIALCEQLGLNEMQIRNGLETFKGVKRRFEYHIKSKEHIYIDDYAHHPTAIKQLIASVKLLYPQKKITGIFQPHLFSRTKDFMDGFAHELSALDELILLPIYPAREEPIKGINSQALLKRVTLNQKKVVSPSDLLGELKKDEIEVLITIGAGDIDRLVEPIKQFLL
jgi:UDP-N-acetylmuramate--alanine ligase